MHVIAFRRLRVFYEDHPDAESALKVWHKEASRANWTTPNEVRASFASASFVGRQVVFNIGGNKYRLIVDIVYDRGMVYIHEILTHAEYDRGLWRRD